jgi:hypothetical protein
MACPMGVARHQKLDGGSDIERVEELEGTGKLAGDADVRVATRKKEQIMKNLPHPFLAPTIALLLCLA